MSLIDVSKITLSKPLPKELVSPSLGSLFIDIGFGTRQANSHWLSWLCRPLSVALIYIYFSIRSFVILFVLPAKLTHGHELDLHYAGDLAVSMNLRYFNTAYWVSTGYTSLLYWWNHYQGRWRTKTQLSTQIAIQDIAPFRFLEGRVSPRQIGLRNRTNCASLLSLAHLYARLAPLIELFILFITISCCSSVLVTRFTEESFHTLQGFLAILVHSPLYVVFCGYFYANTLFHMIYLSLLCKYFKIKLFQLHHELGVTYTGKRAKGIRRTQRITRDLHHLIWEVQCYNSYFWAGIILSFVICFIMHVAILFYVALFGNILFVIRFFAGMAAFEETIVFCLLLNSVSEVKQLGKALYRKLHGFHVKNYTFQVNHTYGKAFRVRFKIILAMAIVFMKMLEIRRKLQ